MDGRPEVTASVVARFGDGGVRRFAGAPEVVVPLQVGPYFATSPEEPETLAAFADALEAEVPERAREYLRLGTDRGTRSASPRTAPCAGSSSATTSPSGM